MCVKCTIDLGSSTRETAKPTHSVDYHGYRFPVARALQTELYKIYLPELVFISTEIGVKTATLRTQKGVKWFMLE